jgi:tetratricopeptide (TPR) repeat protein
MVAAQPKLEGPVSRVEAVSRYGAAVWHLRRLRWLTAAQQLEESLRLQPEAVTPRRELARVYEQLEQIPAALRQLQAIRTSQPQDVVAAEHMVRLLLELGLPDEAAEIASQVLSRAVAVPQWDVAVQLARRWAQASELPAVQEQAWRKVLHWTVDQRAEGLAVGVWTPRIVDGLAADAWEQLAWVLLRQRGAGGIPEAERAVSQAEQLYRRWDDPAALHRLLAVRAEIAAVQQQLAVALRRQREYLLNVQPQQVEPYCRFVHWLRQAGSSGAEVLAELQRLRAAGVETAAALAVQAVETGRQNGQRANAEKLAERVLQQGVSAPVLQLLVREWIEQGRGDTVARWLERLVASQTVADNGDTALVERAQILWRALLAEPRMAQHWLQQLSETNLSPEAAYFLGRLAEELALWNTAERFYRHSWSRCEPARQDAVLLRLLGVLQQQRQWRQLAALCQQRCQKGCTAGRQVFLWRQALALAASGDKLAANTVVEQAWHQTPQTEVPAACLYYSRLQLLLGEGEKGLEKLEQALRRPLTADQRLNLLAGRAHVLQRLGRRAAAIAAWQQVLQIDPDHLGACRELALLFTEESANQQQLEQAERWARHARYIACWQRRLLCQQPQPDPLITAVLGRVLLRRQQGAAARRLLEQAVATPVGHNDPRLWNWLAEVYQHCGERQAAATARQRSQSLPTPIEP